jgi:hypothetical protein
MYNNTHFRVPNQVLRGQFHKSHTRTSIAKPDMSVPDYYIFISYMSNYRRLLANGTYIFDLKKHKPDPYLRGFIMGIRATDRPGGGRRQNNGRKHF